jgi:hypothetical protein
MGKLSGMKDRRCFIQFMHPGGAHKPDGGRSKDWNRTTSEHARKFLRLPGEYLADGESKEGKLLFWAEWEPESEVVEWIADPIADGPVHIYRPFYRSPPFYKGLQNTDPFVFGGFFYTGCKQRTNNGKTETQLRRLKPGSVILFGSQLHGAFVLDTVFVVGERSIDHDATTYRDVLNGVIPDVYKDVTMKAWYGAGCSQVLPPSGCSQVLLPSSYRLYFGATFTRQFEGMYSFFPCALDGVAQRGFARPRIEMPGFVSHTLPMGFKSAPVTIPTAREYWECVVRQVVEQGLLIGTYAMLPGRLI